MGELLASTPNLAAPERWGAFTPGASSDGAETTETIAAHDHFVLGCGHYCAEIGREGTSHSLETHRKLRESNPSVRAACLHAATALKSPMGCLGMPRASVLLLYFDFSFSFSLWASSLAILCTRASSPFRTNSCICFFFSSDNEFVLVSKFFRAISPVASGNLLITSIPPSIARNLMFAAVLPSNFAVEVNFSEPPPNEKLSLTSSTASFNLK